MRINSKYLSIKRTNTASSFAEHIMTQTIGTPIQDALRMHHHMARTAQIALAVDESQGQLKNWGAGLNTFDHQWEDYRSAFVESSLKVGQVAPGEADSTSLHVVLCKSEDDLASEISTSFEAGAAYSGVEVKGSASFLFESKMTSTSSVVIAQVSVCKIKQQLDRGTLALSDNAAALMRDNPVEFVRRYGNYFHMGRLVGGKLTILMHFASSDLSTKVSLDTDLKATFGGAGDAGAKIKAAVTKQNKNSSLDITVYHTGGGPPPNGTQGDGSSIDPDALLNYAMGFEASVSDQKTMPFQVLYDDYGSIGDDGPSFRDALTPAEVVLDDLTDALQDYRQPLNTCDYALDHRADIGFSDAEVATLQALQSGVESDIQAIQDYLRVTSSYEQLQTTEALKTGGKVKQLPSYYSGQIAAINLNPRNRGVNYGVDVWLYLKTKDKFVSAAEYGGLAGPTEYYGKLGANPIKLKLSMSKQSTGKIQHGDQVCISTTESLSEGYSKEMQDLGGAYGDYVGWCPPGPGQPPMRFTILKCHPTPDPTIDYGEPVWIESEDGQRHLEHSGSEYPDYLGLRNIVGTPGQTWIIRKPTS